LCGCNPELVAQPGGDAPDENASLEQARDAIRAAYPGLDFGREVMAGREQLGDAWIDGYMMSAPLDDDVLEVIVDARTGEIAKEVTLAGFNAPRLGPCVVPGISAGTWYSQNNATWSSLLLGNSAVDKIGPYGCVITTLAMTYHDVWGVSTTPAQLNTSAKAAGCFGAGSSLVNVLCAINSRGGPHSVSDISMSQVASTICSSTPVMVDVTWGGGHKMLVYQYTGGSTSSMSSYRVVDPWDGTSKPLTSYAATRWRQLQ
jgi:hypothetical protein